jgi:plastocyanin
VRSPPEFARLTRTLVLAGLAATLAAPVLGTAAENGTLTGVVRLGGPAPARPPLPVFKYPEVCGSAVPDERLVVGPDAGLRYAVVTVEGVRGGAAPERDVTHVLDNLACRFQPHVLVAEVGQTLEIRNGDPILHNADARLGSETLFNLGLPPGRRVRRPLDRPGRIAITCDVRHTWMSAFVVVTDHPYHGVTDAYGVYEIRDVPPARYTVRVWHEELGTTEREITIEGGKMTVADFAYPAPSAKSAR